MPSALIGTPEHDTTCLFASKFSAVVAKAPIFILTPTQYSALRLSVSTINLSVQSQAALQPGVPAGV